MTTLDIPKEINKDIEHFKVEHELKDKREAIIMMLKQYVEKHKRKSMEEVFKEVDGMKPIKVSITSLKRMKEEMYSR